jgi:putative PIN family toxin of toxin-antitoxin system
MPNAVLDSTILVSAFLRREGVAAVLLRHAAGGVFDVSLSRDITTETETTLLERAHIRARYRYTGGEVREFCQMLERSFALVTDLPPLAGIVRDPKDDMVIATALKAQASHIITRDDDLLSLGEYAGITMITPEAFMGLLRGQGRVR